MRDRDALLKALGFRDGPLGDGLSRDVILQDAAGLRPAMMKACREGQNVRSDADLWTMRMLEEWPGATLLRRIWRQRKEADKRAKAAEAEAEFLALDRDSAREGERRWALRCGVVLGRTVVPDAPADAGRLAAETMARATGGEWTWDTISEEMRAAWTLVEGACLSRAQAATPGLADVVARVEEVEAEVTRLRALSDDMACQAGACAEEVDRLRKLLAEAIPFVARIGTVASAGMVADMRAALTLLEPTSGAGEKTADLVEGARRIIAENAGCSQPARDCRAVAA